MGLRPAAKGTLRKETANRSKALREHVDNERIIGILLVLGHVGSVNTSSRSWAFWVSAPMPYSTAVDAAAASLPLGNVIANIAPSSLSTLPSTPARRGCWDSGAAGTRATGARTSR